MFFPDSTLLRYWTARYSFMLVDTTAVLMTKAHEVCAQL